MRNDDLAQQEGFSQRSYFALIIDKKNITSAGKTATAKFYKHTYTQRWTLWKNYKI